MDAELVMDLEQSNRQKVLVHYFHVSTEDLMQIAQGIVPDRVRKCAELGCATLEEQIARLNRERKKKPA